MQVIIDQNRSGKGLVKASVGDDKDFALAEDAGEGEDAAGAGGWAEVGVVSGDGAEVEPAIAERRRGGAELGDGQEIGEERVSRIECFWLLAPERFAHRFVAVERREAGAIVGALQALFRSVIDAGNSLQRKEHGEAEGDLRSRRAGIIESAVLIVIVQEAHEISARFAM